MLPARLMEDLKPNYKKIGNWLPLLVLNESVNRSLVTQNGVKFHPILHLVLGVIFCAKKFEKASFLLCFSPKKIPSGRHHAHPVPRPIQRIRRSPLSRSDSARDSSLSPSGTDCLFGLATKLDGDANSINSEQGITTQRWILPYCSRVRVREREENN